MRPEQRAANIDDAASPNITSESVSEVHGAPVTCSPFTDAVGHSLHEFIKNPGPPPVKWPEAYPIKLDVDPPAAWPERPLSELTGQAAAGGFRSAGWVVKRYVPPPCPPKAQCKPTAPRHVVMGVAQPSDPQTPTLTLPLLTPEPLALKPNARHEISVVLCDAGYGSGVLVSFREVAP